MATFYKILILCVGFAFCGNTWAQNNLRSSEPDDAYVRNCRKYLLKSKRSCGMVIAPSFSNLFGISLSKSYDMLTLIEMQNPYEVAALAEDDDDDDDENKWFKKANKKFPVRKITIDPADGKRLADLIDVAVAKSTPVSYGGLDGVMYYFYSSNDSVAEAWAPPMKYSNCDKIVDVVDSLRQTIKQNNPGKLNEEWWSKIDKLKLSFQEAPELPFNFNKWIAKDKDNLASVEYFAESPVPSLFYITVRMTIPSDYKKGPLTDDMTYILEDKSIETAFLDFCKSLEEWQKRASINYVDVNIIVNDEKESYDFKYEDNAIELKFTLPIAKLTSENLVQQNINCINKYLLEKKTKEEAVDQASKQ